MPPENYITVTLRRNTVEKVRQLLLSSMAPKLNGAVTQGDASHYLEFRPSVARFVEAAINSELDRLGSLNQPVASPETPSQDKSETQGNVHGEENA